MLQGIAHGETCALWGREGLRFSRASPTACSMSAPRYLQSFAAPQNNPAGSAAWSQDHTTSSLRAAGAPPPTW